jgi:dihydrolipoamide dehydrogenase
MENFDVVIIGSGPGGYVAAIRCAQLGMKTALVERYNTLGGTCLNVGCIPSKALLDSSEHFHNAMHTFAEHGIDLKSEPKVNLKQMIKRKQDVVTQTVGGINFLMKKNKISVFHGHGSFENKGTINVLHDDGKTTTLETKNAIIATGSKPASLPFINIDKKRIITSTEALEMTEVPKHLIIIGGGVIGLELGSVYGRLGAKVSVVEYMDSIIPTMDRTMGKELQKSLKKSNFEFYLSHKVKEVTTEHIKKFIKDKIETSNEFDNEFKADLLEVIYKNADSLFSSSFFEFLNRREVEILRDDADKCYFPFQNGIVGCY